MTGFRDLEPMTYFGERCASVLRAIGWLDREIPFRRGASDGAVFQRLAELFEDPFQPFVAGGGHACNVCQFRAERSGSSNLFVPGEGFLFVCPELIIHYINAHEYCPPTEFVDALLRCPNTRSIEYKRRFLENGGRILILPH